MHFPGGSARVLRIYKGRPPEDEFLDFSIHSFDDLPKLVDEVWSEFSFTRLSVKCVQNEAVVKNLSEVVEGSRLYLVAIQTKGFSSFSGTEALVYAKLNIRDIASVGVANDQFGDLTSLVESQLTKQVDIVAEELLRKVAVLSLITASETTMREFMSPVLIAALLLMENNDHLKMHCELPITGEGGNGPVDYVITYNSFDIVLTEAKKLDIAAGMAQNIAQQVASREDFVKGLAPIKKRKYSELLADVKLIPSFGIVTTGDEWLLLKYFYSTDGDTSGGGYLDLVKSETLPLNFKGGRSSEALLKVQVKKLLLKICAMLRTQIDGVDANPLTQRRKIS